MIDVTALGGYLVDGTPEEGDWIWFTGARWIPVPYGMAGEIVPMGATQYPNRPFTSNGYIVTVENLKPGDILVAMCAYIPEANRYHEYITNTPCPDWVIGASDLEETFTAYTGVEKNGPITGLAQSSMGHSFSTIIT